MPSRPAISQPLYLSSTFPHMTPLRSATTAPDDTDRTGLDLDATGSTEAGNDRTASQAGSPLILPMDPSTESENTAADSVGYVDAPADVDPPADVEVDVASSANADVPSADADPADAEVGGDRESNVDVTEPDQDDSASSDHPADPVGVSAGSFDARRTMDLLLSLMLARTVTKRMTWTRPGSTS